MSKRVKKGKNAQKKKVQHNRNGLGVRSSGMSVAQQRAIYEEEMPRAEIGEGVRARSQGTTMPLGVRIVVGIMAFAMLTMMGVVSYSSSNDFDLVEWLTGEDVAPGVSSPTNSAAAFTSSQRVAIDATNKFDGFFIVDEESGLSLTDVNSSRQTADTLAVSTKYKKDADEKRDEVLEAGKEKIQALNDKKAARDEAKQNNPFKKFSDGVASFRDQVVALFTNTYNGLTGKDRAESQTGNEEAQDGGNLNSVDSTGTTDYNQETGELDSDKASEGASDSEAQDASEQEKAESEEKDEAATTGQDESDA